MHRDVVSRVPAPSLLMLAEVVEVGAEVVPKAPVEAAVVAALLHPLIPPGEAT